MKYLLAVMLYAGLVSGVAAASPCNVIGVIGNTTSFGYPVQSRQDLTAALESFKKNDKTYFQDDRYHIVLTQDVLMNGGSEFVIQGSNDVTINGNGFKFYRTANQKTTRMFMILKLSNFTFENVGFDDFNDGEFVIPAAAGSANARMFCIREVNNFKFNQVVVENGKGYSIYVQQTSGFQFTNSILRNAGALGMYIGHNDKLSSNGILIEHSHFYDNATNAVAIQGVTGETQNIIRENLFERNHRWGRFKVAAKYTDGCNGSTWTGGGQLYIASAQNLLIKGNTITDGYCLNCYHPPGRNIAGIELSGLYGNELRVKNVTITENIITKNNHGISQNQNSVLDSSTKVFNNTVKDNHTNFMPRAGAGDWS